LYFLFLKTCLTTRRATGHQRRLKKTLRKFLKVILRSNKYNGTMGIIDVVQACIVWSPRGWSVRRPAGNINLRELYRVSIFNTLSQFR
jgi:hypothetical protein